MRILWPASCRAPRSHPPKPRRTSTRPGCGTWSRRSCSIHRPTASQGERARRRMAAGQAARPRRAAARSSSRRHTARSGGRSASRPGGAILAGIATLRGHRVAGAAPWRRRSARRRLTTCRRASAASAALLPQKTATTVVAEMGPADAERTVVLVAHHDAAHSGLIYHPAIPELVFGRCPLADRAQRHEPAADGARGGDPRADRRRRAERATGRCVKAGMAVGGGVGRPARGHRPRARRSRVPTTTPPAWRRCWRWRGRSRSGPTENVRVMLVSTSEEALCEGMQAFAQRHFAELPRESTFFLCRRHPRLTAPAGAARRGDDPDARVPGSLAGAARRARRGARDRPVPEPAPAERDRRRASRSPRATSASRSARAPTSSSRPTTTGPPTCPRTSTTARSPTPSG